MNADREQIELNKNAQRVDKMSEARRVFKKRTEEKEKDLFKGALPNGIAIDNDRFTMRSFFDGISERLETSKKAHTPNSRGHVCGLTKNGYRRYRFINKNIDMSDPNWQYKNMIEVFDFETIDFTPFVRENLILEVFRPLLLSESGRDYVFYEKTNGAYDENLPHIMYQDLYGEKRVKMQYDVVNDAYIVDDINDVILLGCMFTRGANVLPLYNKKSVSDYRERLAHIFSRFDQETYSVAMDFVRDRFNRLDNKDAIDEAVWRGEINAPVFHFGYVPCKKRRTPFNRESIERKTPLISSK